MLNLSSETELLQVNGDRKGSSPSKTLRLVKRIMPVLGPEGGGIIYGV